MMTLQAWRAQTVAADEEHTRRDREAIGSGLQHVRRVGWLLPLPPTTPIHAADELTVALDAEALYVDVAALAVATTLVGRVRWVRVEPAGSAAEPLTAKDLFRLAAQQSRSGGAHDFLVVGIQTDRGTLTRWLLRPSDLLTQDQQPPFAPSMWTTWTTDGGKFVAGLPKVGPQDAVRRVVAAWITRGRKDPLPWESRLRSTQDA